MLDRAADPRADHPNARLDATKATVVDRDGDSVVRAVIQCITVDGVPFRTATADRDGVVFDGVRIETAETKFPTFGR